MGIISDYAEDKAKQEGKVYLEIDRFFPSLKTCNYCLNVAKTWAAAATPAPGVKLL